jgi:ATP synthase protein I
LSKKKNDVLLMVGRYSALAMMLPAATFVGYLIGYLLDRWLGTGFLKMTFLLIGIAAGFIQLIRELQKEL